MTNSLRPVEALTDFGKLERNPIPPPPKVAWLSLDQLVIDETYQRAISRRGRLMIKRLVEGWNWNCFKALSVAPVTGADGQRLYEVIDGQHSAIAAATHGGIESLPCLVLDAVTKADRAEAFVGINQQRIQLTSYALFRANAAAGEREAAAVERALALGGCTLVESFAAATSWPVGTVACIALLLRLVRRRGATVLGRLLAICVAAGITEVPAAVLAALSDFQDLPKPPTDEDLALALRRVPAPALLDRANLMRREGLAPSLPAAVFNVILTQLPERA
jgi:hypothetical protein